MRLTNIAGRSLRSTDWKSSLSTDVFETRTATGSRMQLLLAHFDHHQSIGKPLFYHFELNATDEKVIRRTREKNNQLPDAVRSIGVPL